MIFQDMANIFLASFDRYKAWKAKGKQCQEVETGSPGLDTMDKANTGPRVSVRARSWQERLERGNGEVNQVL